MGERATFVTSFIYCDECLSKAFTIIHEMQDGNIVVLDRAFAGVVRGGYSGEPFQHIEEIAKRLQTECCHEVKIVAIDDYAEITTDEKERLKRELNKAESEAYNARQTIGTLKERIKLLEQQIKNYRTASGNGVKENNA